MKYTQNNKANYWTLLWSLLLLTVYSCEDFVEVDSPNNQLTGEIVFEDFGAAQAAVLQIYADLRDKTLLTGATNGLGYVLGHYTDEMDLYSNSQPDLAHFYNHTITATNATVANFWSSSYHLIYACNNALEKLKASSKLKETDKNRLKGEVLFFRGLLHFYLTSLFGEIPYVKQTDPSRNTTISKQSVNEVYESIEQDFLEAKSLLNGIPVQAGSERINMAVVSAFMARVYLQQKHWQKALDASKEVIEDYGFILEDKLDDIYKADSTETIWQFSPQNSGDNTQEAFSYIFIIAPPANSALSANFVNGFEAGDLRKNIWVGSITSGTDTYYYPNKYQQQGNTGFTKEKSVLIRLSEMYYIQAESYAQLNQLGSSLNYLNSIRTRAGLGELSSTSKTIVLNAILKDRSASFFCEFGMRWFDLLRFEKTENILPPIKSSWKSTNKLFPIPDSELQINPNLKPQNNGY